MQFDPFHFIATFFSTESPTNDQLEEFLGEIATMKRVGKHPNVVRLLGFCTVEQPLIMIMEFVPCGDLVRIVFSNAMFLENKREYHASAFT